MKHDHRSLGSSRPAAARSSRSRRRSLGRPALATQDLQLMAQDEGLDLAVAPNLQAPTGRRRATPCRGVRRPSLHPREPLVRWRIGVLVPLRASLIASSTPVRPRARRLRRKAVQKAKKVDTRRR